MRPLRRTVALLSIVAVAAVALAGAAVWWVWLPGYRPALGGERHGIDVSSFQGQVDWPRVAGDDIDFAYVKATEGGDFVDRRFAHNWQGRPPPAWSRPHIPLLHPVHPGRGAGPQLPRRRPPPPATSWPRRSTWSWPATARPDPLAPRWPGRSTPSSPQ